MKPTTRNNTILAIAVFTLGILAVFFWARYGHHSEFFEIHLSDKQLTADGNFISEVIKNKKDNFPDFPDSSYKIGSLELRHLREALTNSQETPNRPIKLVVPDSLPFVTWVPILATIKYAGNASVIIESSHGSSTQINFLTRNDPALTEPSPNVRPGPSACVIMSPDSIFLQTTFMFLSSFTPSKDSVQNSIKLGFRSYGRIHAIPAKYQSEELDLFTRSLLDKITDSTRTIHFAILPTVITRDFTKFHHDFDSSAAFHGKGYAKRLKVWDDYQYALDWN